MNNPATVGSLRPRTSPGFTLLEVMLAIGILAIVVTTIYASFSMTSSAIDRAEAVREATDLARTLLARLTSDIANATCKADPKTAVFSGRKSEVEINGEKRRFDDIFLTTLTNWRTPDSKETELWEVGYYFEERPGSQVRVLMRREKRELSKDVPPREGGVDYELTDRIEELKLRYFTGSEWQESWDKTACSQPKAVEISLWLKDGGFYTTKTDVRPLQ